MRFRKDLIYALPALLTAITSFIIYIPSLKGGFLNYDDWLYYEDPHITSFELKRAFTEVVASNWHPLTVISYAVDYKLWGLDPFGYHLENVILHSLNTFLVFMLTLRLCGLGKGLRHRVAAGVAAALLFGLHPLHVESVSWVAERKDVLCAFFFISSLIAYTYFAAGGARQRALKYIVSLGLFALALMSKPMAVSLPLVLLIMDFYPLGRLRGPGDMIKLLPEKIPFIALGSFTALLTLWAQKIGGALVPVETYSLAWRLRFSVRAIAFYLYKTALPTGLSPFYPIDVKLGSFGVEVILGAATVAAVTLFTVLMVRRCRILLASWAYFIITLIPVIGIVQVGEQAAADRYMYLPSLSLFVLAGTGFGVLLEAKKKLIIPASACVLIALAALSALTIRQQAIWRDSITLWDHEVKNFPGSPRGYNSRGSAYAEAGRLTEAMEDYNTAIRLKPDYAEAYVNRALAYRKMNEYSRAADELLAAIRINPRFAAAYYYLSRTFADLGETGLAVEAGKKASELGYRH